MQKTTSIFLIILLLLVLFGRGWTFIAFRLQQSYIAKYLCEERDNPASCCAGKCQLTKQLKQQKQQGQIPLSESLRDKLEVPLYFVAPLTPPFRIAVQHLTQPIGHYTPSSKWLYRDGLFWLLVYRIFHPPCC